VQVVVHLIEFVALALLRFAHAAFGEPGELLGR
jgi:hypothetical protein